MCDVDLSTRKHFLETKSKGAFERTGYLNLLNYLGKFDHFSLAICGCNICA